MSSTNEQLLEKLNQELLAEKNKSSLSHAREELLYGVQLALAMVDGDINDYLFNATGGRAEELLSALHSLGAEDVKNVVEEAIEVVKNPLPKPIEERQALILGLDEEIIGLWDDLTEDYYDLEEDFWNLLLSFG